MLCSLFLNLRCLNWLIFKIFQRTVFWLLCRDHRIIKNHTYSFFLVLNDYFVGRKQACLVLNHLCAQYITVPRGAKYYSVCPRWVRSQRRRPCRLSSWPIRKRHWRHRWAGNLSGTALCCCQTDSNINICNVHQLGYSCIHSSRFRT